MLRGYQAILDCMTMQELDDLEIAIKIIVVGNGTVGKSSLIRQYCQGVFTSGYKKTIGVDFLERRTVVNGEFVRLMLWDTAGQEEFDTITRVYYRGAQACIIAYSLTDRQSFIAVDSWKKKVEDETGSSIITVLMQNKLDLISEAVITQQEAEEQARKLDLKLFQTSVRENKNIDDLFQYLAETYMAHAAECSSVSRRVYHIAQPVVGAERRHYLQAARHGGAIIRLVTTPTRKYFYSRKQTFKCLVL